MGNATGFRARRPDLTQHVAPRPHSLEPWASVHPDLCGRPWGAPWWGSGGEG